MNKEKVLELRESGFSCGKSIFALYQNGAFDPLRIKQSPEAVFSYSF